MCGLRIYCLFVWLHMPSLFSKYRLNHGQNKSTENKTDLILCIKRYTCLRSFNWLSYNRDAFSYSFVRMSLYSCNPWVEQWKCMETFVENMQCCVHIFPSLNGNKQEKLLKNWNQLILVWKRGKNMGKRTGENERERHGECERECRVRSEEEWEAISDILLFSENHRFFFVVQFNRLCILYLFVKF